MRKEVINKNILIVGLSDDFVRLFSSLLADKLDFYYLDVESLLEYSIMDRLKMEKVCGVRYLDEQEKKVIKSINDYQKTVISMKLDLFIGHLKNILSNNILVYLKFDKTDVQNLNKLLKSKSLNEVVLNDLVFEERDKYLKKNCEIVLDCDIFNIENSINILVEKIINLNKGN